MQKAPTLIDTGPIVAILNQRDPYHAACSAVFQELAAPLSTCWPVVTEAAYILGDWSPATGKLFALLRTRALSILPVGVSDIDAIEVILTKYADQKFQLADATLMHLAQRENIRQVLTLDRKDFTVFRTASGKSLDLLPSTLR
jgi:hypothetical protein